MDGSSATQPPAANSKSIILARPPARQTEQEFSRGRDGRWLLLKKCESGENAKHDQRKGNKPGKGPDLRILLVICGIPPPPNRDTLFPQRPQRVIDPRFGLVKTVEVIRHCPPSRILAPPAGCLAATGPVAPIKARISGLRSGAIDYTSKRLSGTRLFHPFSSRAWFGPPELCEQPAPQADEPCAQHPLHSSRNIRDNTNRQPRDTAL